MQVVKGWNLHESVRCVECPDCGFTMADTHEDVDGGYSCPQCVEPGLRAEIASLRRTLRAIAGVGGTEVDYTSAAEAAVSAAARALGEGDEGARLAVEALRALPNAEVERLRALVEAAFREGSSLWGAEQGVHSDHRWTDEDWQASAAKAALDGGPQ